MKYVLTEQQNERIMKIIKSVADTYTNEYIVKTDVEVESANDDSGDTYYILHPIFYIDSKQGNMSQPRIFLLKHEFANFVESVIGFPVHSFPAIIKMI